MCNISGGFYDKGLAAGRAEGIAAGMEKGIAAGMEKGRADIIDRLLKSGMSREEIRRITGV